MLGCIPADGSGRERRLERPSPPPEASGHCPQADRGFTEAGHGLLGPARVSESRALLEAWWWWRWGGGRAGGWPALPRPGFCQPNSGSKGREYVEGSGLGPDERGEERRRERREPLNRSACAAHTLAAARAVLKTLI